MSGHSLSVEIDAGDRVKALIFTANGEYLVTGLKEGVQVWRVHDGKHIVSMQVDQVHSLAVSKDGRYIAAGLCMATVFVWDAMTYEQVIEAKTNNAFSTVFGVDFSSDSTRFVSANGSSNTATVWDVVAGKKVLTLDHEWVEAAKYSLQGNKIATASKESVRVWDSNDGRLLIDVKVGLRPSCGLLWFNDYLFVKTRDSKIKQIESSTGSSVAEWTVPYDYDSCISLPQHGKFIAYSTEDNVTFWDTSTHTQLGLIPRTSGACAVAFSPDDRLFSVVSREKKIIIKTLPLVKEPEILIENAALDAWKHGQLTDAEASLTAAISMSEDRAHILSSRALVRARLRQWDEALVDAEESINTQPSIVGFIAKCVALVGKGDAHAGYRVCDIAALHFYSDHVCILLFIKAVVLFIAGEHEDAISRMNDLTAVRFFDPTFHVVQAYMHLLLGNKYMESGDCQSAIQSFEHARIKLGNRKEQPPLIISLISGWEFDGLAIVIQQQLCEALFLAGRAEEAGESVLRMVHREVDISESIKMWALDLMRRCLSAPESSHNGPAIVGHKSTPHPMTQVFRGWVELKLTTGSWQDALVCTSGFMISRFAIYQILCEHLEMTGDVVAAVLCFSQMYNEGVQETNGERANWTRDFVSRCRRKLEDLGDSALSARLYDEAISQYTAALSLGTGITRDLLIKRSMARVAKGEWDGALSDSNEVIKLDPSSPLGYERRHAALRGMGSYGDATHALEMMLSKMSESSDPEIYERSHRYVRPEKTKEIIRTIIGEIIRDSPPVLINTASGRLCNESEQAAAFEMTPTFTKLISSMTTHVDHTSITEEVGGFYRYATFSHKWEENEPLFETVIRVVVYDLEASPTHEKLQMFCKIVREAGFNWAWSDTCCINKGDHFVLQEALVSMFNWYERSAMTIIFLRGVDRLARRGALTRSIWNMRAWTLQEYHASKVVRIYTEDWTPYLGLEIYNHKESPEIISEMEEATGISAQALKALRPGLNDIREKLRLASTRQTTRVEDAAYSLLGIFSMTMPITYGEGDKALGQLLSRLLASSGNTSILAWTGRSGSFNSCLPFDITVFRHPPTSHIPPAILDADLGPTITGVRSLDFALLTRLYDRVNELSVPSFSWLRMKLPCLAFKVERASVSQNGLERIFRLQTTTLGVVEVQTNEDLSRPSDLCLAHPWIDFLLDRQPVGCAPDTITENTEDKSSLLSEPPSSRVPSHMASTTRQTGTARLFGLFGRTFGGQSITPVREASMHLPSSAALSTRPLTTSVSDTAAPYPPSTVSLSEKQIRVLRFIARLRQPFGTLLLTPTRRNVEEYRRVATESLITVRLGEVTPEILDALIDSVRMLDVL